MGALGALFVLTDQMTVGALIAFNMMGLRLAQPLIQASGLMQDYQRAVLSLKLLAHVLGVPTPKDDIDGSQVGEVYWSQHDLPRIVTYCQKDVVTVA